VVEWTEINWSSVLSFIAMSPEALKLSNSEIEVFLISPVCVAIIKWLNSQFFGERKHGFNFLTLLQVDERLTSACPLA